MKRLLLAIGSTVALTATLILGTGSAAAADTTCPDGYACFWTGYNFTGAKRTIPASYGGLGQQFFDNYKFSMKNRFGNRAVHYWLLTGEHHCRDASGEHHQFNYALAFQVTGPNGHC